MFLDARRRRQDDILIWQNQAELPKGTVAAIAAGLIVPELVAVAPCPVAGFFCVGGGVLGRCCLDPPPWHKLLPLPRALLQKELPKARNRLGREMEAGEAEVDTLRIFLPVSLLNAKRVEQTRSQVVDQLLARYVLEDGREHKGGDVVVGKDRARRLLRRRGKKARDPVVAALRYAIQRVLHVAGRHGEQVVDAHRLEVFAYVRRHLIRKERAHGIVHGEPTFLDGQANRRRRKALAQRVEQVNALGAVGRPPALGDHVAVAQEHEAVEFDLLLVGGLEEVGNGGGRDTLGCGRAAGQLMISHRIVFIWVQWLITLVGSGVQRTAWMMAGVLAWWTPCDALGYFILLVLVDAVHRIHGVVVKCDARRKGRPNHLSGSAPCVALINQPET